MVKFTCESKPEVTKWMDYGKDHYATVTFDNAPEGDVYKRQGYKNNEGVLKYTDFENISARLNTSWNLNKIVTDVSSLSVAYVHFAMMPTKINILPHHTSFLTHK